MTILDKIILHKRKTVEIDSLNTPLEMLKQAKYFHRDTFSLKSALLKNGSSGIIAEFKRKSPSKGIINDTAEVANTTMAYVKAGASALSVLTDNEFFGGSNDDLKLARKCNAIPILRKDFIVDEYQIYEAKSIGADAILLIAAVLSSDEIERFTMLAHELGMEVLLEIHHEDELMKICPAVNVIGINNRNLKTFEVSLENSIELSKKLPEEMLKISESGIKSVDDIFYLRKAGFQGFLMGENFMKQENPGLSCENFIKKIKQ